MSELKAFVPCQFCGGTEFALVDARGSWAVTPSGEKHYRAVSCSKCDALGPEALDDDAAIELYNTRVPAPSPSKRDGVVEAALDLKEKGFLDDGIFCREDGEEYDLSEDFAPLNEALAALAAAAPVNEGDV